MSSSLAGRVAVITGASRGLGAGLAEEFQRHGLKLGLCSRSPPCLPPGEGVVTAQLDVRDAAAVELFAGRVAQQFGTIDLWINNSGVLDPIVFLRDLEPAQLEEHLAVNVVGVLNGTRSFVRHVRSREGGGVLLNISSGAARSGYAGWGPYCAGKAAVDRLSECAQLEEEASGLRVHSVAPGIIDTGMQERIRSCTEQEFPQVAKFHKVKADGAFNSPEHVARHLLAVAFDASCRPDAVVCSVPPEAAGRP